tara:strand:+ start:17311 stop:18405 length:1095 start_codon:yes stop_codon:yes gene_type:complete
MKNYIIGKHEKNINISENEDNIVIYLEKDKLSEIKAQIDDCDSKKWEDSKKKLNIYEYIYTSSKQSSNICKILPISRSYFKLHEIVKNNNFLQDSSYYACIAEGPGGFIHCINQLSKYEKKKIERIYGITLISKDKTIPYWNQNILNNSKNKIINGKDNTGNIYKYENVEFFIKQINHNYCTLVTADGGFDYSKDYNSQELLSYKLLYSEIYIALNIQKLNGNFVIKFFDLFRYKTIQLIYLLYCCYSEIHIYKPCTSRLSNSEKYIICKGFTGCNNKVKEKLKEYYDDCEKIHIDVPESFLNEINKFNEIFVSLQMNLINNILELIKTNKKLEKTPSEEQIRKAIEWCEKYELPINDKCTYLK